VLIPPARGQNLLHSIQSSPIKGAAAPKAVPTQTGNTTTSATIIVSAIRELANELVSIKQSVARLEDEQKATTMNVERLTGIENQIVILTSNINELPDKFQKMVVKQMASVHTSTKVIADVKVFFFFVICCCKV